MSTQQLSQTDPQMALSSVPDRVESDQANEAGSQGWGRLPGFCVVIALGLALIATADSLARVSNPWTEPVFWAGFILMIGPVTFRMLSDQPSRKERIGLVVVLGFGLFFIKILHSPIGFTFTDEMMHWRTAIDIDSSHHLFTENALLPVSPYYPGLEIITTAFAHLTGLTIFEAGMITIGIARIMLVLAFYGFFEQAIRSPRVAGLATLMFMGNSNFIFFNAQFSYASIGVPLAAAILAMIVYRVRNEVPADRTALTIVILVCLGAMLITHHATSYVLIVFLIAWAVVAYLVRPLARSIERIRQQPLVKRIPERVRGTLGDVQIYLQNTEAVSPAMPDTTALLMAVGGLTWLASAASVTIRYLAVPLVGGLTDFARMLTGQGAARQLFQDFTGLVAPLWERLTGFAAIAFIGIGLLIGLWALWKQRKSDSLVLTLALAGACYPALQVLRLNASAWEISNRMSEFVFVAVGFVIAAGLIATLPSQGRVRWFIQVIMSAFIAVIIMGGLNSGWPFWARTPGPYLVAADTRSMERQSIEAAKWTRDHLKPGNRVASDRINRLLQAAYGEQDILTNIGGEGNVAFIFMSPNFENSERSYLINTNCQYLVVDTRLSLGLPVIGIYYEKGEPDTNNHTTPLLLNNLTKFDKAKDVSRIFDSGGIVIYDVSKISLQR